MLFIQDCPQQHRDGGSPSRISEDFDHKEERDMRLFSLDNTDNTRGRHLYSSYLASAPIWCRPFNWLLLVPRNV